MPENITNIAKWKEYPFLNKVLTWFNDFNESVEGDDNKRNYYVICNQIIEQTNGDKTMYQDFCEKLLRNLGHHSRGSKYFNPNHERCNILYNWIYNTKKSDIHTKNIIDKCFDDYNSIMKLTQSRNRCSHISHDDTYVEPIKISILNIFDANISFIKDALEQEYNSIDSPSQKYVCECVKIYKEIEKKHCTNITGKNYKRDQTCEMLNTFKRSYMEYIYNKVVKKDKIPSLENVESEYMRKCSKNRDLSALASSDGDSAPQFAQSTTTVRGNSDASQTTEGINEGDRANSLSPTVSTALGTVAGASSLLALLYKFTPGRNWMRSGIRGSRGRINSNLYAEEPSELLFDGMEHNDFNSYSIGYEAI